MKKTICLFIFLFVFKFSFGQQLAFNAKKVAQTMIDAYKKKDYNSYVNYLYPAEIRYRGGKEKFIQQLKSNDKTSELLNIRTVSEKIGRASQVYRTGSQIHCAISFVSKSNSDQGLMVSRSTLLAISSDQGKSWKFILTGGKTPAEVHKMLPKFNEDLMWEADTFELLKN